MLKHEFESAVSDDPDVSLIQPSHWNAEHAFDGGATGSLLYRDTGQATGANWLADVAVGSVLVSGGVGAAPAFSATPSLTSLTLSTPLTPANGGTGLASYAVGDLIYASGATTLANLADVATGSVLASGGVGTAPAWSASPTLTSLALTSALSLGSNQALSATKPTFTSGFGGSTGRSITGTGFAFTIVCGNNGSDDNGVLAMPFTAANGWVVFGVNQTQMNAGSNRTTFQTAGSTTSVTLTQIDMSGGGPVPFGSGDVLKCIAVAY